MTYSQDTTSNQRTIYNIQNMNIWTCNGKIKFKQKKILDIK